MGKRSGVPHRDDELAALTQEQITEELARAKSRLRWSGSAKQSKAWRKQIPGSNPHWPIAVSPYSNFTMT